MRIQVHVPTAVVLVLGMMLPSVGVARAEDDPTANSLPDPVVRRTGAAPIGAQSPAPAARDAASNAAPLRKPGAPTPAPARTQDPASPDLPDPVIRRVGPSGERDASPLPDATPSAAERLEPTPDRALEPALEPAPGPAPGPAPEAGPDAEPLEDTEPERLLQEPGQVIRRAGLTGLRTPRRTGLSGSIRAEYRLRATHATKDHDIYQHLSLRYTPTEIQGLTTVLRARVTEDVDRFSDRDGFYVFDSVADTYAHRVSVQLYEAYVEYEPCSGPVERVRLGRQAVTAGDYFQLDGVHLTSRPIATLGETTLALFGGLPAHIYESSVDGELMAGFSAKQKPWTGGHLDASFIHFEDENRYYGSVTNDLLTLDLRQRFGPGTNVRLAYRHLNGDPNRLDVSFDHFDGERDLLVRGYVRSLLTTQSESTYDLDPFVAITQQHEPYADAHLAVSKDLDDKLGLEVGVSGRRLWDAGDEGRYNREYGRYYATLSTYDWPRPNLSLALTVEGWKSSNDHERTVTFDIDYRPSQGIRIWAGADYALYRTDFYADEERIDAYGLYAGVRMPVNKSVSIDLRLRLERDDDGEYATFRAGTDWDF